METNTLKDLIDMGVREIYIKSYGYEKLSCFGSTWQSFGNKPRYIRFTIEGYDDYANRTFFFDEEPSLDDVFELREDKWFSVRDFDLYARSW